MESLPPSRGSTQVATTPYLAFGVLVTPGGEVELKNVP